MRPATPGRVGHARGVMRASSTECVTAVMSGLLHGLSPSPTTKVPGVVAEAERQWMRTPWLRAYSTERSCSTPAPEAAISSISSNETTVELARVRDDPRVGRVDAGDVGVDLADLGVRARPRARPRVVSEPPRPSVVTSCAVGDALEAGDEHDLVLFERRADAVGAHVEDPRLGVRLVSVTMPACEPVSEIARWPRSLIAIAHSAQRDALAGGEQHVHLARVGARRDLLGHRDQLVGRLAARRQHGDDAVALLARARRCARAARLMRSASATDVPPNFMHDQLGHARGLHSAAGRRARLPSVTSSAYSRSRADRAGRWRGA